MYTQDELQELSHGQLLELIQLYSRYVQEYPDEHEGGGYPVSFNEWYNNDHKESENDN